MRRLALLLAFAPLLSAATDPQVTALLESMAKAYTGLQAIHITAMREDAAPNSGATLTEYDFAERAGGLYFIQVKQGSDSMIKVNNGEKTWKAIPRARQFSEIDAAGSADSEEDVSQAPVNDLHLATRNIFLRYRNLVKTAQNPEYAPEYVKDDRLKVGKDKIDCSVLRLKIKGSLNELWIDKQRGFVLQHIQNGNAKMGGREVPTRITIKVKSLEINDAVPKDLFDFQPPSTWRQTEVLVLPGEERQSLKGLHATDFHAKLLDGGTFALNELRGKVVVADFWATWCGPCRAELPIIQKLHHDYADKAEFIGVNDEESGVVKAFLAKNHYDMSVCMDGGTVHRLYGVSAIPRLLILDRDGVIQQDFIGTRDEKTLRLAIDQVIGGTPASNPNARKAGALLISLDPAATDDASRSINGNTPATIDFINRSSGPVDLYWIDYQGNRHPSKQGLRVGETLTQGTFITHPFLVVASNTGGTTARDTGTRIAAFVAVTPNTTHNPAIGDTAIIRDPDPAQPSPRTNPSPVSISSVTFEGSAANPVIRIAGSGFASRPAPSGPAHAGYSGENFGTALHLSDLTGAASFHAGYEDSAEHDDIGLVLSTYTDNLVVLTFGANYIAADYPHPHYQLNEGDSFTVFIRNQHMSGVVHYATAATAPAPETQTNPPPGAMDAVMDAVNRGPATKINRDGLTYVWIRPGSFTMGCSEGDTECFDGEKPPHEVQVASGFWLSQTLVTQAAWQKVMGTNPSRLKGDRLPVEKVTWNDAVNYCTAIGGRLPKEFEWEYAARAGTKFARYGNLDDIAWHGGNSEDLTHPVAQKQPNAFALYDMLGNVWEWVLETYPDSTEKILRGGGFRSTSRDVRASRRGKNAPTLVSYSVGFRCAMDASATPSPTSPASTAGAYKVGGDVTAPQLVHEVEASYSKEAQEAKYNGTVLLHIIVNVDGTVGKIAVTRGVGLGLDEKAIEAVKQWKFKPGTRNGIPVPVQVNVEVNFRL